MVFFYVIYTCVNFIYLFIYFSLLVMGGAMVLVAHGWVAVMGGPVRFLAR